MLQIDIELQKLKSSLQEMWVLVEKQLRKSGKALLNFDKATAREVISREKMVNAMELKIDADCEAFIATYNPVAIDLRLALSVLKINNNLERIGDFAEGIALFVLKNMSAELQQPFKTNLNIEEMFNEIYSMYTLAKDAFANEDTDKAEHVFGIDNLVDEINIRAVKVLADEMLASPEKAEEIMFLHAVVRRLERIGDRCSNIAEEIVFYLDAKVLKHKKQEG
jgi:phosphate transport system protein